MWTNTGQRRPAFALTPGPGQESVWDYPRPPALEPEQRPVRVLFAGTVIGESDQALRVLETAHPPSIYLPPDAVDTAYLQQIGQGSICEWKGQATYWDVVAGARVAPAAAWSYHGPSRRFAALDGWLSFYPGKVDCFLGDERVRPQPGAFYGGWLTDNIVGPVKGGPGTGGW
jgi:uncharacterized protein (DUF427 family)